MLVAKKTRRRQQLSCAPCHQDKKKCGGEIPCDRCVQRGSPEGCYRTPVPSKAHPPPATELRARVAALEQALAAASLPTPPSTSGEIRPVPGNEEVEEAAKALGSMSATFDRASGKATSHSWYGDASVASFLRPVIGSSAPLQEDFARFDTAVVLPPRALAEHLGCLFYTDQTLSTFIGTQSRHFLPPLRALVDYCEAIATSPDVPLPLPTSLSFVSLVYIILATGLQFLPDASIPFVQQFYPDYHLLQQRLHTLAKDMLALSEDEEPADMYRIETTILHGLYQKNRGRPTLNYHLHAQAIRTAQAMGYHREGDVSFGLSPFDAEVRRRLWWSMFAYDRMSNLAFGRPYVIHEAHCDVKMPMNVDISTLDPSRPRPILGKPREEVTPYSGFILQYELAVLVGRLSDRIFSARPSSYRDVLECDATIVEFEKKLPAAFRSPAFELLQQHPYLGPHMAIIHGQITWVRAIINRPYLRRNIPSSGPDPFARSRMAAISLSQKLISMQRDLQLALPRHCMRFFLICFQTFDPAATLAMAILQDPLNTAQAAVLDKWILTAQGMLRAMGNDNVVAREGVRCLSALRAKIAAVVPAGTQLGPLDPVDFGPIAIPYLSVSFTSAPSLSPSPTADALGPSPPFLPTPSNSNPSSLPSLSPPVPEEWNAEDGWEAGGEQKDTGMDWPFDVSALESLSSGDQWSAMLERMGIDPLP